ncbi:MAG TPA: hypothetical protein VM165_17570 [Planctomycetaceae bacterium]|nr:hypothetical protein [Planctomycetaceae bacterium]
MLSRREFLATAAVVAGSPLVCRATTPSSPLLFAPQTGLLERSVGCDPAAQIERSAALGFRAYCDPQWRLRSDGERNAMLSAARQHGIRLGPMLGPSFPSDVNDGAAWLQQLSGAVALAAASGLPALRLPLGPVLVVPLKGLWRAAIDIAAPQGISLMPEPWCDQRIRGGLIRGLWLAQFNAPVSRLSLDWGLWPDQTVGRKSAQKIGHVELPELRAGNRPRLAANLQALMQSGYRGVFALKQGLSGPTMAAEEELVSQCRALEQAMHAVMLPATEV